MCIFAKLLHLQGYYLICSVAFCMNTLEKTIDALNQIGEVFGNEDNTDLKEACHRAHIKNQWFTPQNISMALSYWSQKLRKDTLNEWVNRENIVQSPTPKTIGVITAGNIPLVGLHDIVCVLITGNTALVKLSTDDEELLKFFAAKWAQIVPEWANCIQFTERINTMDAIIATGSNNTARYFEYYFGKYPHIIRKNRNSIAVLTGDESPETLASIGRDVITYFGKGCRNVTQVWAPTGYEWPKMLDNFMLYGDIINHHKYANNYTYHKAILLMNLDKHLDTGFLLLKEDTKIYAPISMLNYAHYTSLGDMQLFITENKENIQCVISEASQLDGAILPGQSQNPQLWDYADGVNTIQFLMGI